MTANRGIPISQGFMLLMLTAGLTNHVMIIPVVLEKSARNAWITVAVAGVLFIPWILIAFRTMKNIGTRSISKAVEESSGKFARILITSMIALYLIAFAFYTLKEVIDWTKSTYLLQTPVLVTSIFLITLCLITAVSGMTTIGITAGILLPVVIMLGIFVATVNVKYKDYSFLFPILEDGLGPIFKGLPVVFGGLTQFILAVLIVPHTKGNVKLRTALLFHVVLIVLTLGPTIAGISEFGADEMKLQRYPAYEQWRLVKLGKFIEHVDFLSIYQWLSGAYISISLCIHLAAEALFTKDKRVPGMIGFSFLLVILCASPISNLKMYFWMRDLFIPSSAVYTTVLLLLMTFLIRSPKNQPNSQKGDEERPCPSPHKA